MYCMHRFHIPVPSLFTALYFTPLLFTARVCRSGPMHGFMELQLVCAALQQTHWKLHKIVFAASRERLVIAPTIPCTPNVCYAPLVRRDCFYTLLQLLRAERGFRGNRGKQVHIMYICVYRCTYGQGQGVRKCTFAAF